ncbi:MULTISPECIES: hypothetical protein [Nocardiopsis]|jgi:hypothetical protein|uniref:Uncharacterized protein n=1 Tax=Nocardiopsis tropica TaxID=109330 RepID=A0ABU7KRG8_9ACTN|nr:hypothetical protein [Nocardiopsis umidischolae]MEE2047254.1 hypothetical protein [Nocardiopsis tropica]MEE2051883.1 hypothetical protein [Nocardiopsis umidischolae]
MAQSRQTEDEQPTQEASEEHGHLGKLAGELSRYSVRADVVDGRSPYLRVSNPASTCAVEDVICERREFDYAFLASFGVHLGSSGSLGVTAHKVAWLVGATEA